MSVCFSIGVEGARCYKRAAGLYGRKDDRGLSIHAEMRKGGRKRSVCERKGVTECNDNARFMQPCIAEELANAARNFFSSVHLSVPLYPALRCSCNAVAVGRKPRRKETSRIALHSRARSLPFVPPKFIREDASVPPRKLESCRRATRVVVASERPKESRRPRSNKSRRGTDNR